MTSVPLAELELAIPEINGLEGCALDRMATGLPRENLHSTFHRGSYLK